MMSFFQWISSWFQEVRDGFAYLPLFIQSAIVVSLLAIAGTLLTYLGLMVSRGLKYYRERRNQPVALQSDALILEYMLTSITAEAPAEPPLEAFRKLPLHRNWARHLLVQKLLHYQRNFSGVSAAAFRELYEALGLHKQAERKLRSGRPSVMVEALSELFNMEVKMDEHLIMPLTHHSNRYVREMARCYLAKCSADHPLDFLADIQAPLLPWEQFELFRVISQRKDLPMPAFMLWMQPSLHPTVISFALRMAVHFQQFEAAPAISKLLKTDNIALRALAINSLGKLMAQEFEDTLLKIYADQPVACKMEILKALGRMGTGRHLAFLKQEFMQSPEFELKKHAARSIVSHAALAQPLLWELQAESKGQQHVILQHCLNPSIKF